METDPFARWYEAQKDVARTAAAIRVTLDSIDNNQALHIQNLERICARTEPQEAA